MDLRYPIGPFQFDGEMTGSVASDWIDEIAALPGLLREAVADLDQDQLDTPYRPEGWTVRQVIHHVADSHMNAYTRFKLALTEERPTIKPYNETKWAELPDYQLPVETSLVLLESLHERWTRVLRALTPDDMEKTFIHPESGEVPLGRNIGIYAWHGKHHLAHITSLRDRMGW
ncbi:YfiT family bacillithiol transferase [Paenibacillus sp. NFR01]|uniref:YfiT family bacillithiol transferase n=1 Tax=Paenibacillus sp. NFR01 TaxID=1566279 RepID=UPI0008BECECB|nr:putative metal-dependent hydrolase [Paenibacillus sp. NFR01]SET91111.1 DinB superfamily protein [Paenibacillus sp. NFR01]